MCQVTGDPLDSFAKSTLETPNASKINISGSNRLPLVASRSDFNIQSFMVRICKLLSVDPASIRGCRSGNLSPST
jgi:hypothetical protein